jgi:hypothetical protein
MDSKCLNSFSCHGGLLSQPARTDAQGCGARRGEREEEEEKRLIKN